MLKTISAVLPNEGRRLIRFAQTSSTCHDLEIRHKNGREKKERGKLEFLSDQTLPFTAGGDQILSAPYWKQAHLVKIWVK